MADQLGPAPVAFGLSPSAARIWEGGPSSNCWRMRYAGSSSGWELDGGNGLVLYRMSSSFDCAGPNTFDQLVRDWTAQAPPAVTVWPFSQAPCECPGRLGPDPVIFNITPHNPWLHEPGLAPRPVYLRLNAGPICGEGGPSVSKFTAIADADLDPGQAVYVSADSHVDLAQADDADTTLLIGLAIAAAAEDAEVEVQTAGVLTLSAAEWDAICGTTGGLTPNAQYYLSPDAPGLLTETRPVASGEYIVVAGVALSTTQMELRIEPPLLL